MGLFGRGLDYEPKGDYVTAKRVGKLGGILADNERVEYLTRGSQITVNGEKKSGTSGFVRAAFTAKRVAVKIPQMIGSDEYSVPYQNITSIDLDIGALRKNITIRGGGVTYKIRADSPDRNECREAIRYAREQMASGAQPSSAPSETKSEPGTETDPAERLRQLKSLHEDGIITEDEFEEKRKVLLEKI